MNKTQIKDLEKGDMLLLRKILAVPESTCTEALFLETGCLDIETIIKGRRLKFLHYLVKVDKNTMLYQFFKVQLDHPVGGDWTIQCRKDMVGFDIPESLDYLEGISKNSFK